MIKIGISACFFHADPKRAIFKGKTLLYAEESLIHWVQSQNALTYLIPSVKPESSIRLKDLAMEMDGLILEGGSDVAPETYRQSPIRPEWAGDFIRDQYEIALLREFLASHKPVLGICRGAQLINVAFGGTLYQDISTQLPRALVHRDWNIYDQNFHSIEFSPDSKLSKLYPGLTKVKVNSIHHQGIQSLGKDLLIEARSEKDNIIEAIRLNSPNQYLMAVQWHPEFHDSEDLSLLGSDPLLQDFLNEVRKRKDT